MGLKIFFIWWNRQTFGTFLKTLFFGKFVGSDENGNKYYRSKKNERWVVYAKNIEATKITSLAVTKLDGTAKGGVVIGISDQLSVPVKFIGVGEGMEDLQLFNPEAFASTVVLPGTWSDTEVN